MVFDIVNIYPVVSGDLLSRRQLIMIAFLINCFAIGYLLARVMFFLLYNDLKNSSLTYKINFVSSIFFKLYCYIFFIPFLRLSVELLQIFQTDDLQIQALAILNIIFTIFIGLLIEYHNFDNKFDIQDYLAKQDSVYTIIYLYEIILWTVLCSINMGDILPLFHIFLLFIQIVELAQRIPYYSEKISILHYQMITFHFIIAIVTQIYIT